MTERPRVAFDLDLTGLADALPVLERLPDGDLARELAEEQLGRAVARLDDGRWAVAVDVAGLRLFAVGDELAWDVLRPPAVDESDATAAASRVHRSIGGKHADWDADR